MTIKKKIMITNTTEIERHIWLLNVDLSSYLVYYSKNVHTLINLVMLHHLIFNYV